MGKAKKNEVTTEEHTCRRPQRLATDSSASRGRRRAASLVPRPRALRGELAAAAEHGIGAPAHLPHVAGQPTHAGASRAAASAGSIHRRCASFTATAGAAIHRRHDRGSKSRVSSNREPSTRSCSFSSPTKTSPLTAVWCCPSQLCHVNTSVGPCCLNECQPG